MSIADYCRPDPVTAVPADTLQEAAKRMDAAGVGCLVVVDDARRPLGVITDRDLALQVLRHRLDPSTETLEKVMHHPVITVTTRAPVIVVSRFMREHALRRIPVVDPDTGALVGIVSSDDLLQLVAGELSACAEVARQQFPLDVRGQSASSAQAGR